MFAYRRAIRRGHYAAAIAILDNRPARKARAFTYGIVSLWIVAILSWVAIASAILP